MYSITIQGTYIYVTTRKQTWYMYTMSEERVTLYKKIIRYLLITFSIDITYVFYITLQLTFPTAT